jgi:tetratricopeptide (TPR) repeat protein
MSRTLRIAATAALALSAGGCALVPHRHHLAEIRPVAPLVGLSAPREDGYYASAKVAIARRDYARALELLQAANAVNPHDVRILNAFGVVYDKLGRFDLSERYYVEANALDPASPIVANNMAWSAALRGRSAQSGPQLASAAATAAAAAAAAAAGAAPSPATVADAGAAQPPPAAAQGPGEPGGLARRPAIMLLAAAGPATGAPQWPTRHGLLIEDASGQAAGATPVVQGLVRMGWTTPRVYAARESRRVTYIAYPAQAEALAKVLARSLPMRVALVDCGASCSEVRLVVGTDAARWTAAPRARG